jgi:PhoPQ-activated pathogenicity-related protein
MTVTFLTRLGGLASVLLAVAGWGAAASRPDRTALDEYVGAPDPNYKYELVRTLTGTGYTAYVLRMTSQSWRKPGEVDRTLWEHWLTIVKPDEVRGATALLLISGGSNGGGSPQRVDAVSSLIAVETRSVVANLRMVPNQPLTFVADESAPRREDSLIAYTWDKFLRTGDSRWPARLPMTKSAVRAMDAVTAFCASAAGGNLKVERFFVAGGSKRGWTTWTTAAVDPRVIGIAPAVVDVLNLEKSLAHQYRSYGSFGEAVGDYVQMGIMDWFRTPQMRALRKIEDPYEYRRRFTMPKYIVNSAGDEFFLPDSSQFYFDELPGEKYLRYIPNTDHSLNKSDVYLGLAAFYDAVLRDRPRPRFSWDFEKDGAIRVRVIDKPSEVKLWQATNPKARDFRLASIGPAYSSTPLADQGGGTYVGRVPKPAQGWTAFFVELTYPSGGKLPFKFTTAVRILPDRLPFPPPKPDRRRMRAAKSG